MSETMMSFIDSNEEDFNETLQAEINQCNKLWKTLNEFNCPTKSSSSIYLELSSSLHKSSLQLSRITDVYESLDSGVFKAKRSSQESMSFLLNLRNQYLENDETLDGYAFKIADPELDSLLKTLKTKNKSVEAYLSEIDQQLNQLSKYLSLTKNISDRDSANAQALISKNVAIITEKIQEESAFLEKQLKTLSARRQNRGEINQLLQMLNGINLNTNNTRFEDTKAEPSILTRDAKIFSQMFGYPVSDRIEEKSLAQFNWSIKVVKADVKCIKEIRDENYFKVVPHKTKAPIIENPKINIINRRTSEKLNPMIAGIDKGLDKIKLETKNISPLKFQDYSPKPKEDPLKVSSPTLTTQAIPQTIQAPAPETTNLPKSSVEAKPNPSVVIHYGNAGKPEAAPSLSKAASSTPLPASVTSVQKNLSPLVTGSIDKTSPSSGSLFSQKATASPSVHQLDSKTVKSPPSVKVEHLPTKDENKKPDSPCMDQKSPSITPTKNTYADNLFGSLSFGTPASTTKSSMFGGLSVPKTVPSSQGPSTTSGGFFGNTSTLGESKLDATTPNSSSTTPSGLFGINSSSGSLFGTSKPDSTTPKTTASSGGLFGTTTPLGSPSTTGKPIGTHLFGNNSPSTTAATTSLFGALSTNDSKTTSLFGSKPTNSPASTATGLFSTNNTPSNPGTSASGLFTTSANTSATNIFGTPTKPPPTTNIFAQTTQSSAGSLFGSQNTPQTTTSSIFGGNSSSSNTTGTGLFGSSKTSAPGSSMFGNAVGIFGSSQPAVPTTSQSSGGLFGSPSTQQQPKPSTQTTGGLFGSSTTTGSLFGSNNQSTAPSGGLFGNQNTASPGGLFGSSTTQSTGGGLFGSAQTTAPVQGNMFSSANNTNNQSSGGGLFSSTQSASTGLFGSSDMNNSGNLFSNNTQKPTGLFASASTAGTSGGLFGSPSFGASPAFGQAPAASSGLFGSPNSNQKTGLFGSVSNQGSSFASFNQIASNNSPIQSNNIYGNSPSFTQRRA